MMIQLNPPLPVVTPRGKGLAQIVIDYGPEYDIVWVVFLENGVCWSYRNQDIRAEKNMTFGRNSPELPK